MSSFEKNTIFKPSPKIALSKEAKVKIINLSNRQPIQFLTQLVLAWAIIFTSIYLAVKFNNIFVYFFAVLIISTRQNVLGLLVHEQTHCLGFKARFGDTFTNLFAAYPLLVLTVEGYSQAHLSHHKFFMSEKDQDLLRKSGENWQFPMKATKLGKLFLTDMFGLNLWRLIKGKKLNSNTSLFKRTHKSSAWVRPLYYLTIIFILIYTNTWALFLLFWLVPLLTFSQAIVRWGAICEHQYTPNASIEECSPVIILNWWEKLLFPNLNFTLHPYHHYFPGVPFSRLPEVHKIFLKEGLINRENIFYGNFSYLRFLLKNTVSMSPTLYQNKLFERPNAELNLKLNK